VRSQGTNDAGGYRQVDAPIYPAEMKMKNKHKVFSRETLLECTEPEGRKTDIQFNDYSKGYGKGYRELGFRAYENGSLSICIIEKDKSNTVEISAKDLKMLLTKLYQFWIR
jgi:hypothetical protein